MLSNRLGTWNCLPISTCIARHPQATDFLASVLNYMPRIPSCPKCLHAHVLYMPWLLTCLPFFISLRYSHFFTYLPFYTYLTCHFFTCLHFYTCFTRPHYSTCITCLPFFTRAYILFACFRFSYIHSYFLLVFILLRIRTWFLINKQNQWLDNSKSGDNF